MQSRTYAAFPAYLKPPCLSAAAYRLPSGHRAFQGPVNIEGSSCAESLVPTGPGPDLGLPGGPAHMLELGAPGARLPVRAVFHVLNPTDDAWDWSWQRIGSRPGTPNVMQDASGRAFTCEVQQGRAAAHGRCQLAFTFTPPTTALQVHLPHPMR